MCTVTVVTRVAPILFFLLASTSTDAFGQVLADTGCQCLCGAIQAHTKIMGSNHTSKDHIRYEQDFRKAWIHTGAVWETVQTACDSLQWNLSPFILGSNCTAKISLSDIDACARVLVQILGIVTNTDIGATLVVV